MKIKIIILSIISLIFLTGCSIDYKANILSDGQIEETIKLNFSNEIVYKYNEIKKPSTIKALVKDKVAEFNEYGNYALYDYNVKVNDKTTDLILKYKYADIDEFKEKNPAKYYFRDIKINKNNKGNNVLSFSKIDDSVIGFEGIDKLIIKVYSNNFIENENSTSKNEFKGSYKWNVTGSNIDSVKLTLTSNENWKKKYFENVAWLFYPIIGIAIVLIILFVLLTIYNKNKLNNKL